MKLQAAGMIEPPPRGLHHHRGVVGPALHARDHVHRHLVDVVGQVPDGLGDAGDPVVGGGCGGAPLDVGPGDAAPQLPECGPPLRVRHHHEVIRARSASLSWLTYQVVWWWTASW